MAQQAQTLSDSEQKQLQAEQQLQQAEAQTGTTAIPRTTGTQEPTTLDARFDRDDLRQGKPVPAMKKHKLLRIRRAKGAKGTPLSKDERKKALAGDQTAAHHDEAEMTDEELELTDDEEHADVEDVDKDKKPGLLGKVLGKS